VNIILMKRQLSLFFHSRPIVACWQDAGVGKGVGSISSKNIGSKIDFGAAEFRFALAGSFRNG
jgi:hypothetical protein